MTLKSGKSSFRVVGVFKSNGCPTKFPVENRFESSSPEGAIRKAFTQYCNRKNIKGQCSLFIKVENTTNDHKFKGKTYLKKCTRHKLDKPLVRLEGTPNEFVIEYETKVKSVDSVTKKKGVKCKKSSGRMKKRTRNTSRSRSRSRSKSRSKSTNRKRKSKRGKKRN